MRKVFGSRGLAFPTPIPSVTVCTIHTLIKSQEEFQDVVAEFADIKDTDSDDSVPVGGKAAWENADTEEETLSFHSAMLSPSRLTLSFEDDAWD